MAPASSTDRRPVPTVAIVGNDALLAAAPATPVQLAHACLQYGFSVAVPASWGDELVATEAVRRLAARDKGPAVMCVCPYVRSRLLAPGPDLAPFLLSLQPPPVATARYLRSVYGEHGVQITYIGACPGADDPVIDVHLTPETFLADIAERGIALSEQPLVFDSIVPPDRRRWCSLPGGVPTADVLWSESETRALVEIDRDDAATDLAQHIITHEHVLLDLAPSLGCACSGAVPSLSPRSARVAVTSIEPPRAAAPIIDPAAVVPLDAPLRAPSAVRSGPPSTPGLGTETGTRTDAALAAARPAELLAASAEQVAWLFASSTGLVESASVSVEESFGEPHGSETVQETSLAGVHATSTSSQVQVRGEQDGPSSEPQPLGSAESFPTVAGSHAEVKAPLPSLSSQSPVSEPNSVRRRTPQAMAARSAAASVPRTVGEDGRLLPRAYVAKRRTPPNTAAVAAAVPSPSAPPHATSPQASNGSVPDRPAEAGEKATAQVKPELTTASNTPSPTAPSSSEMPTPEPLHAEPGGARGVLVSLFAAVLLALGVFVLWMLRR